MSEVNIRAATPADLAAITRIYADAVKHGTATFEIEPPDETEMARRRDALLAKDYPYLVAERAGAIAGYAYAGLITSVPRIAGASRIRFTSIPSSSGWALAGCSWRVSSRKPRRAAFDRWLR